MRNYLIGAGFPASKIGVVANPVGSISDKVKLAAGGDVLFARRLEPEKGLRVLLDAWRSIDRSRKRGARLHIAGAGSEVDLARAASSADGDVRFHGRLTPDQLEVLGQSCKVSVIPSLWEEPFGRTVIEAYRSGRGVVVTNKGALPELVQHGRTGWVGSADKDGRRSALIAALAADQDSLRGASHETWRTLFTREAVAARYRDQWGTILADAGAATGTSN